MVGFPGTQHVRSAVCPSIEGAEVNECPVISYNETPSLMNVHEKTPIADVMHQGREEGWALAAFNAPGFDAMDGIAEAVIATSQPAIIQISARLVKSEGAAKIKALFDVASHSVSCGLYLHLDHCADDAIIDACIDARWDMVMFDGSHLPIEENVTRSARIAERAHKNGVAVEGEVGPVGGEEDGISHDANYADLDHVRRMAEEAGLDCLAVGFGNVHGDYSSKAALRWDIFEDSGSVTKLPLVLHGGTGLSDSEFARAIAAGAAKVNISTDLKKRYRACIGSLAPNPDVAKDPSMVHCGMREAAFEAASHYITLFSKS